MKIVLQRVISAKVSIDKKVVGTIQKGYVLLLGVAEYDSKTDVDTLVDKIIHLRIMNDENHKMNVSLKDVNGEILLVSQFTLLADIKGGRRPSFIHAAKPEKAKELYEYCIDRFKEAGIENIQTGRFGEYMFVDLVNDGPVTICIDSVDF